jgi:hypothetical protein
MMGAMETTTKTLYDTDFVAWTEETARLIRECRFHDVDLAHLAEEIEDLGKSQRDAVRSQLQRMLLHLLKQRIQPERAAASWRALITSARAEIEPKLDSSPSLRTDLEESLEALYKRAIRDAIYETKLSRNRADEIPPDCPWTLEELLGGEPE